MSSTSESNTVDSTTERTGVQESRTETSNVGSINMDNKINTNTQTGQVSQTY